MSKKLALVLGATSAIAKATLEKLAVTHDFILLARSADKLQTVANHLHAAFQSTCECIAIDFTDTLEREKTLATIGGRVIDLVFVAYGTLPLQAACEQSVTAAEEAFIINAQSVIAWLTPLANTIAMQGHGVLAVITSVAADRGRASNYVYGAAKAAVSTFVQGLALRFGKSNAIHVVEIKPGFVDTPMTASFKKGVLWATPEKVAGDIVKALYKKQRTVYTPWFWRYIMLIIMHLPFFVMKRLNI